MDESKPRIQSGIGVSVDRGKSEITLAFDCRVTAVFLSPEQALVIATAILQALLLLQHPPQSGKKAIENEFAS